jgi:phosphoserine phosphatase
MHPTAVLATLTGRDRPGVTASVFAALAAYDVDVRDVEQIVIRDRLVLSVLFDLRGDPAALRASLTKAASALGMDSEVVIADPGPSHGAADRRARTHVVLLGQLLRPGALGHVAQYIADLGANIESISRVADQPAAVLELVVRSPSPARLRGTLVRTAKDLGFDIAAQPAVLRWRPKRLVLLDVTTALVPADVADPITQLAERAGREAECAAIAAREAAGELDCAEALRAQAELLAGLAVRDLERAVPVCEEAREAIAALRALGFRVGAVCGDPGFDVRRLAEELCLDFAAGNRFEARDGVLTGRLAEPLADRAGKAAALVRFAEQYRVPLSQTVAVGAGANDLDLLQTAGLAVACTGAVSLPDLLRCVLGAGEDVREAAQSNR